MALDVDSSVVYVLGACLSLLQIMQCGGSSTRDHMLHVLYSLPISHSL